MHLVSGYPLWTGRADQAQGLFARNDEGIEAIVDLAANELPPRLHRDVTYLRFPISDGAGNPRWQLAAAIDCVAALLRERVPTLVCCSAGLSRSLAITAAALARVTGSSLHDALLTVAAQHGDVSPALLSDVERCIGLR